MTQAAIAAQTQRLAEHLLLLADGAPRSDRAHHLPCICYIGAIRNRPQAVIDLLGLPRLVMPIAGMTVGWPAAAPALRPRLPLAAVLRWERYDHSGEDQALAEYDRAMAATGIYAGRQVPVPGQPGQLEDYGWTEHSARRVSQPHRTHLRAVLEGQGFELR